MSGGSRDQSKQQLNRLTSYMVLAVTVAAVLLLNPYWIGMTMFGLDLSILMGMVFFFVIGILVLIYQYMVERRHEFEEAEVRFE